MLPLPRIHRQHPNSKTVAVGFRPGCKTKQKRLTKVLAKAQSGNDSFILFFIPLKKADKEGLLDITQQSKQELK